MSKWGLSKKKKKKKKKEEEQKKSRQKFENLFIYFETRLKLVLMMILGC